MSDVCVTSSFLPELSLLGWIPTNTPTAARAAVGVLVGIHPRRDSSGKNEDVTHTSDISLGLGQSQRRHSLSLSLGIHTHTPPQPIVDARRVRVHI